MSPAARVGSGPCAALQLAWLLAHSEAAEAGGGLGVESQRPRPLGRPPSGGPRFPRGRRLHSSHILHPQSISQNSGGVCPAWWPSGVGTARPGSGPHVHPLQSGCRCPEGAGLVLRIPDTRPAGVSRALQRDAHGARLRPRGPGPPAGRSASPHPQAGGLSPSASGGRARPQPLHGPKCGRCAGDQPETGRG